MSGKYQKIYWEEEAQLLVRVAEQRDHVLVGVERNHLVRIHIHN